MIGGEGSGEEGLFNHHTLLIFMNEKKVQELV